MSKGNYTKAEVEVSLDYSPFDPRNPGWPSGHRVCLMRETPSNDKVNCGQGRQILPADAKKIKAKILAFRKEIWAEIQKAEVRFERYQATGKPKVR
jgi:hypothetical protein